MVVETFSPRETFELGKKIGQEAIPGTVITLTGDLGAGKTVFTQGVAAGLGITEPVSSPTFTIVQIYEGGSALFIIWTYTGLGMFLRWTKWDMKIIFTGTACA